MKPKSSSPKKGPKTGSKFLDEWKRQDQQGSEHRKQVVALDHFLGTPARVVAEMSSQALKSNYQAIQAQVPGLSVLPMIKANAYGHGVTWAGRELIGQPGLYGLGVATLREAQELRESMGEAGGRVRVLVFSDCLGWTEEKADFCEKYAITPVISSPEDWSRFCRFKGPERLSYELKFNTGMNRLGIPMALAAQVARKLSQMPASSHPDGILSHLAMAETPQSRLSVLQRERFMDLKRELVGAAPSARFHLGNSAAIWNEKFWKLKELSDVVRPGLALYGVTPWSGAPLRGIAPVMRLKASILAVHRLKPGECVGYGGRFRVGSEPVYVATVGAGYADGIHRRLSGDETGPGGYVWLRGREQRILGTVSMDLCSVSCSSEAKVGDWVEFLGERVDPWAQSRVSGTIPYELLTSVSGRVQRVYD